MANIVDITNLVDKSIDGLQDVDTSTTAPSATSILKYDGSNWSTSFESELVTTNREVLSATKTLTTTSKVRQYLDPDGVDREVVLPDPPIEGMIFFIKSLDGANKLDIKETAAGPVVLTISTAAGILESYFIYDGNEWHAQGPGNVLVVSTTPDTDAYILALGGLGVTLTAPQVAALELYETTLRASGTWAKVELIMPFLGSTAAAQSLAWTTPVFPTQPENRNFVDGDTSGNSLTSDAGGTKHINTKVTLNDLVSTTEITMSVAIESTVGGPFAGIFNDDATGDDTYLNIGYGPFDGIFYLSDTTYFGYFGDPLFLPTGDFVTDTTTSVGSGTWTGLFTGLKPNDSSDIFLYYGTGLLASATPANPAITAPIGLMPTPVTPPEMHVFGFSGAPNPDNHNGTGDLEVSWFVLGSDWSSTDRANYLTATQTLFTSLGKTFQVP